MNLIALMSSKTITADAIYNESVFILSINESALYSAISIYVSSNRFFASHKVMIKYKVIISSYGSFYIRAYIYLVSLVKQFFPRTYCTEWVHWYIKVHFVYMLLGYTKNKGEINLNLSDREAAMCQALWWRHLTVDDIKTIEKS